MMGEFTSSHRSTKPVAVLGNIVHPITVLTTHRILRPFHQPLYAKPYLILPAPDNCSGPMSLLLEKPKPCCLSNALHNSIGQNIKSPGVSGLRSPVSDVRSVCEKLRMAITQQRVTRSPPCLVLGWGF